MKPITIYKGVKIYDTPCYPAKYNARIHGHSNATHNFFKTIRDAKEAIDRMQRWL